MWGARAREIGAAPGPLSRRETGPGSEPDLARRSFSRGRTEPKKRAAPIGSVGSSWIGSPPIVSKRQGARQIQQPEWHSVRSNLTGNSSQGKGTIRKRRKRQRRPPPVRSCRGKCCDKTHGSENKEVWSRGLRRSLNGSHGRSCVGSRVLSEVEGSLCARKPALDRSGQETAEAMLVMVVLNGDRRWALRVSPTRSAESTSTGTRAPPRPVAHEVNKKRVPSGCEVESTKSRRRLFPPVNREGDVRMYVGPEEFQQVLGMAPRGSRSQLAGSCHLTTAK